MYKRRADSDPSEARLKKYLLGVESIGVLDRRVIMKPVAIKDGDTSPLPPRLVFIPRFYLLVHIVGDAEFYRKNPDYLIGGLSKECHILDSIPRELDNFMTMEQTYRDAGVIPKNTQDPLSLRAVQQELEQALRATPAPGLRRIK